MNVSTNTIFDLNKLYQTYFNSKPYYVSNNPDQPLTQEVGYSIASQNPRKKGSIVYSKKNIAFNKIGTYGQDIWFPIELWKGNDLSLEIEACTVGVHLSSTVIKTPVNDRKGSVHESFSDDDVRFSIRGFLIGKNRTIPEDQIQALRDFKTATVPKQLRGGYPELFMEAGCNVVVLELDFPEVQGRSPWIRPFTMNLESDYIQDLILK